jgi:hypothetical protein
VLMTTTVETRRLAPLLLCLLAPVALAEPHVLDASTGLSLDLAVKGASTCVTVPDTLYDPQACQGIPRKLPAELAEAGKNLHLLGVVDQSGASIILTLSSVTRPGIGQMDETRLRAFIDTSMKNLAKEFGAKPQLTGGEESPFTLTEIRGVPVARWEYKVDLLATGKPGEMDSGVAWLIPSKDTIHILSLSTHRAHLETARTVGAQLMSTLQLPVTVDAASFGKDSFFSPGASPGGFTFRVALVAVVCVSLVWLLRLRLRKGANKK